MSGLELYFWQIYLYLAKFGECIVVNLGVMPPFLFNDPVMWPISGWMDLEISQTIFLPVGAQRQTFKSNLSGHAKG